jgi:hypothetical protein
MFGLKAFFGDSAIEQRAQSYKDPVERLRYLRRAAASREKPQRARWIACLALALATICLRSDAIDRQTPVGHSRAAVAVSNTFPVPNVWPVEQNTQYDLYSNGLRIENRLAISNEPRSYHLVERTSGALGPVREQPAGIVFHTTEGDEPPFEPGRRQALKRMGEALLEYVRGQRAYHFVIDRFGRVHRIVVESDAANHAGPSVWADSKWAYVGLNASFLGVAFEARTQPDQPPITEAQLRAGTALTEMLRSKYNLAAEDCVTHAQVSINPSNMQIGYHTDWGAQFPFRQLGLPDNYPVANPSLYLFGFQYDPVYTNATGPDLWTGLALAEEQVRQAAAARGVTPAAYRKLLQQRFRDAQSALRDESAEEDNPHESN